MLDDNIRHPRSHDSSLPAVEAGASLVEYFKQLRPDRLVDSKAAMATLKDSMKYVLDQAYVISRPTYPQTTFWWSWLKNYTGEYSVGYVGYESWA